MSTAHESPPATLKDFLTAKADEYGVRDRIRRRKEWLDALERLYRQLETWMREADPEGLLDIVPYTVQRSERGLGTFDVPALLVSFGPEDVSIEPMSTESPRYLFEVAADRNPPVADEVRSRFRGRVDVSNHFAKFYLLRRIDDPSAWRVWDGKRLEELDRDRFEAILKELLA